MRIISYHKKQNAYLLKLKLNAIFPPALNVPGMPNPINPVSLLMGDKGALLP